VTSSDMARRSPRPQLEPASAEPVDLRLHVAPGLDLPREAVTQTFAILAKRGAGKTHTASVMAEEMIGAGARVVVLDPVGVWWGLRASADGGPGLPVYILGGNHADLALPAEAGGPIASLIAGGTGSFVLDVSLMSKTERRHFIADFAERLFRENQDPLHVMIDEADTFAPQRLEHGNERMFGAIDTMVRQGRVRGIGVTLISQRPAVVNKDVLTQTEVLLVLRITSPQDRKAIDDWIAFQGTPERRAEILGSLAGLPIGTAWAISPGWLDLCTKVSKRARRPR